MSPTTPRTLPVEWRPSAAIARLVGAASLATIALGVIAQMVFADQVIVAGDWQASAVAVVAEPSQLRWAALVSLVEMVAQVVMIAAWARLVLVGSPTWAAIGGALALAGAVIKTTGVAATTAALPLATGAAPDVDGVAAALAGAEAAAAIGVLFLGAGTVALAIASARARVVPMWVAVVVAVSASAWLVYLDKPTGDAVFGAVSLAALVGALTLAVRFLGWGVGTPHRPMPAE